MLNILDVFTVNNVYRLQALKFTHLCNKGFLTSLFQYIFQYTSEVHGYNTEYASKKNLNISKVRTNSENQTKAYTATTLWNNSPTDLKDINAFNF